MKTLHFSEQIDAPKATVWSTMLEDGTYRDWSSAFGEGSHYVGDWEEGSRILFLAPGDEGRGPSGMVSLIAESRPHDLVRIEHVGTIEDGVEDTGSDTVKAWGGAFETYRFHERGGGTEVFVELDVPEAYVDTFEQMWPKALHRLKALAEQAHRAEGGSS